MSDDILFFTGCNRFVRYANSITHPIPPPPTPTNPPPPPPPHPPPPPTPTSIPAMYEIHILCIYIPYIFLQVQSPSPSKKWHRQALILRIHSTVRVLGLTGHLFNNVYYMPALIIIMPSTFTIFKNSQIIHPTVCTIVAVQVQKSRYRLVLGPRSQWYAMKPTWWKSICHEHDDVIKWKHFPRCWPFVRGIHRWPLNFPHKGQWRGALMFSWICAWINGWVNTREAGNLRLYRAHNDVTVMEHGRRLT